MSGNRTQNVFPLQENDRATWDIFSGCIRIYRRTVDKHIYEKRIPFEEFKQVAVVFQILAESQNLEIHNIDVAESARVSIIFTKKE